MKHVSTGLLCGVLVLLMACGNSDKKEISELINTCYAKREHYANVDKGLLSSDLVTLIKAAEQKEKDAAEQVAKSDSPTDKPLLIEGDIFTGLYEGPTSNEILETTIQDSTAIVKVRFTNNIEGNITWEDEIHVVKQGSWKIDNVVYGQENPSVLGNLKAVLTSFNQTEL